MPYSTKTLKFANIFALVSLGKSHIDFESVESLDTVWPIVYDEIQAFLSGVESFKFVNIADFELLLKKGPGHVGGSCGKKTIQLDNLNDQQKKEDIEKVFAHEYRHFKQYKNPINHIWTAYYHLLDDISNFGFIDESESFKAMKEEIPRVMKMFPGDPQWEGYCYDILFALEGADKAKLKESVWNLKMMVHVNAPHEIDAIIHDTYTRLKAHASSPKFESFCKKFHIQNANDYTHKMIEFLPTQIGYIKYFTEVSRKKLIRMINMFAQQISFPSFL